MAIGRERRPRSIHRKIALTTTVIAVSSLLVACTGLIAYQLLELWRTMRRESSVVARVIGETAQASLVFRDAEFAASVLEGVSNESHIVAACIYDQDGQIFATYLRQGVGPGWEFPVVPTPGHRVAGGYLSVFEEIHLEGEIVGTVLIQVDLSYLTTRLGQNAMIALLVADSADCDHPFRAS